MSEPLTHAVPTVLIRADTIIPGEGERERVRESERERESECVFVVLEPGEEDKTARVWLT